MSGCSSAKGLAALRGEGDSEDEDEGASRGFLSGSTSVRHFTFLIFCSQW